MDNIIIICSAIMLLSTLLYPFMALRKVLYIQVIFFALSHVYISGFALFVTMVIYAIKVFLVKKNDILIPRFVFGIYVFWVLVVLASWLTNDFLHWRSVFQAFEFTFYFMLIVFIYSSLRTSDVQLIGLLNALLLSAVVLASTFFVVHILFIEWPENLIGRNEGAFYIVMTGIIIPMYLFLTCGGWKKIVCFITIFYSMLSIVIATDSRSGIIIGGILIMLFVILLANGFLLKRSIVVLLTVFFLMILMLPVEAYIDTIFDTSRNYSNIERLLLLETSYDLLTDKPLLGWGWGSVEFVLGDHSLAQGNYPHPHNTYARFGVELGIAGIFVIISLLLFLVRSAISAVNTFEAIFLGFVAIALLLFALVDALFYGADRGILLSILIGVCMYMGTINRRSQGEV